MTINFSQVGQDVANTLNAEVVRSNENRQEQQTVPAVDGAQQSKDLGSSADNQNNREQPSDSIETAVAEISEFVQSQNRQLQFSIDENTNRSVVRVTDSESGDVIRQIPSEEVLALSDRIRELQSDVGAAVGVLFNRQV